MPSFKAAFVLACLSCLLWSASRAQESTICATNPQFIFKSNNAAGGLPSAITAEGQDVYLVLSEALPPIIIQTVDVPDGTVVRVTVKPTPILLGGDTAQVILGVAYFPALTLADNLPVNSTNNMTATSWLSFDATDANGQSYSLKTGQLHQLDNTTAAEPVTVNLLPYGFLRRDARREVPNGYPMGEFYVGAYDYLGRLVELDGYATVSLPQNLNGSYLTNVASSYPGNGAIGISGVTFNGDVLFMQLVITVTIDGWPSFTFTTNELNVANPGAVTSNEFMEFDPVTSFITVDNQGATGVMGIALPPIVINLLKSDRSADTSNIGLVILATASQGSLVGGQALVVNGVATFSSLYFATTDGSVPPAPVITFTVSPVTGRTLTLVSGFVSLAADVVRAKQMRFAPWSAMTVTSPSVVVFDSNGVVTLPYVAMRIYDSAFALDHEAQGFDLIMSVDPPNVLTPVNASAASCAVRYGLCVIPSAAFKLTISKSAADGRVLRFVIKDDSGLSARNPLTTNDITLKALTSVKSRTSPLSILTLCRQATQSYCTFTLSFVGDFSSASSVVFDSDVPVNATVGTPLGAIRLRLQDDVGPLTNVQQPFFPNGSAPVVYAYTGTSLDINSDPYLRTTNNARLATIGPTGEFTFSCLVFDSLPVGLVRLQFMAYSTQFNALDVLYARTGFVRVASAPTSLYQLRFASDTGSFSTPPVFGRFLQRTTAVAGVDLPPVIVEVADSVGVVNTGDTSLLVTVVASATNSLGADSGTILDSTGTSVDVVNGQAIFQNLRITTSSVDDVYIVFTATRAASALSSASVVGQAVRTGVISVSSWPQRVATHMDLVTSPSDTPSNSVAVTVAGQSFTVVNLTNFDAYMEFTFRDSMHTVITNTLMTTDSRWTAALDGVTAQVSSDQVLFPVTKFTIDTDCACLRIRLANATWRSTIYLGTIATFYATVAITAARNPYMMQAQFPLGPVTVTQGASNAAGSCAAGSSLSAVYAEFQLPSGTFDASSVVADMGLVMGIDPSRIAFDTSTVTSIQNVDHSTLAPWSGTKVKMSFEDPRPGDLNRKPGSTLATEIVGYRADCGPSGFLLRSAHLPADDHPCDQAKFDLEAANATACLRSGVQGVCACYAYGVLSATGQGPLCIVEKGSQLSSLCVTLASCSDAAITDVCAKVPVASRNYTGLYVSAAMVALLSVVGGVALSVRRREAVQASRSLAA